MLRSLFKREIVSQRQFLAMGTWITIKIAHDKKQLRPAIEVIDRAQYLMEQFGRDAWAWGDGAVAKINQQLALADTLRSPLTIPSNLKPLFDRAWELHLATDGLYEPRIAELVKLWGFDTATRFSSSPPSETDIQKHLTVMANAKPYLPTEVVLPVGSLGWDFGGIGKGYIVDKALSEIASDEFIGISINAGGNLATRGNNLGRHWRTGIRDPAKNPDENQLLASLATLDESVNTHGNDQRNFYHNGRKLGHILDPKTGWPAEGVSAVTVVHKDGCVAEAAGAALYVAGLHGWRNLANKLGLEQVMLVTESGAIKVTEQLYKRLDWNVGYEVDVI